MARIPLTIDPGYCEAWGYPEGIRELIQNAKDGEEFDGCPMHIEHLPRTSKLVISNKGAKIAPSTLLLLGRTSKQGGVQRGKFGEGFVLGVLALIRAEHPVTIYNGDEVWRAEIATPDEGHPFEGQKLLVFNTRKLPSPRDAFTIEVENVSKEVWAETRKLFLFVAPPKPSEIAKVHGNTVLFGTEYSGMVFARGIYVNRVPDLEFGYDLENLQLDRDRRLVDEYDLRWKLGELWNEAHSQDPEKSAARIYRMAKESKSEVKSLQHRADDRLVKALREEFEKEHGVGTVAVESMSDSKELEQLGARTAVVSKTLHELLERSGAMVAEVKRKLKGTLKVTHAWRELTAAERTTCLDWVERVARTYVIVTFNDPKLTCRLLDDDQVAISRWFLSAGRRHLLRAVAGLEAMRCKRSVDDVWLDALGVAADEAANAPLLTVVQGDGTPVEAPAF
jgi:hypothetical protein